MFGSPETSPPNVLVGVPVASPLIPIEAFGNDGFEIRAKEISSFSPSGGERKIMNHFVAE
jgi:hypothetical protein